jgi:hypothetical protein
MWFKQLSAPWLTCQMQFLTSGNDKVASSIPMSATAKQTQKNGGVPYPKKLRNNKIYQPNSTQLNPTQPNPTQTPNSCFTEAAPCQTTSMADVKHRRLP